jgi:hypothetical protein
MMWSWKRDCQSNLNPKRLACFVTADLYPPIIAETEFFFFGFENAGTDRGIGL